MIDVFITNEDELQNLKFNSKTWNRVGFFGITFQKDIFNNLSIYNSYFIDCTIEHCNFNNCKFDNNIIFQTEIHDCHFNDCIFSSSRIDKSAIYFNNLDKCIIKNITFAFINLQHNIIQSNCILYSIAFYDCYFYDEYNYVDNKIQCADINFIGETMINSCNNINFFNNNVISRCPESGSFIGWKKCKKIDDGTSCIVKLEIPEDALRSNGGSNKCRANKVKVLEIQDINGNPINVDKVSSYFNNNFFYSIGKTIEIENFDTNRFNTCAPGIHFFLTRKEAVDYKL